MTVSAPERVAVDFYNLEISLTALSGESFGVVGFGAEDLSYNWTLNESKMYGGSRLPVDRTEGDADFEGSVKLNRSWANYLYSKHKELGIGIANLEQVITVTGFKNKKLLFTDTLYRARLVSGEHSNPRGPESLMVTHKLSIMNIYFESVDIFGGTLGV